MLSDCEECDDEMLALRACNLFPTLF